MSLTKQDVHRVYVEANGLDSANDNAIYINLLLYNLVLKGIVDYELLTLREKKSINMILADEHKVFFYDQKTQQIKYRSDNK